MTIATTLQQQKSETASEQQPTRPACTIEGGLIRRLIIAAYFIGLTIPTLFVLIFPDPRVFLVYSVYLFFYVLSLVPSSLTYLSSIDSSLVFDRSASGRLRLRFI
ncbi:hypothetical protein PFISCL1PPCAC_18055, partial [Pristionchus fissidentatus]